MSDDGWHDISAIPGEAVVLLSFEATPEFRKTKKK
jgi:hypothetical protein